MPDSISSEIYEDTDLTVLIPGPHAIVDIVAVENIGETSGSSWTYEQDGLKTIWLQEKEFLQEQVPTSARVFSFGYRIQIESTLNSLAKELLRKLREARDENQVSPKDSCDSPVSGRQTYCVYWARAWWASMHGGITDS
jgi:hypothetical protein